MTDDADAGGSHGDPPRQHHSGDPADRGGQVGGTSERADPRAAVRRDLAEERQRSAPARGTRRRGEMSLLSGLIGITAVAAATLAASVVGALISALATLLF